VAYLPYPPEILLRNFFSLDIRPWAPIFSGAYPNTNFFRVGLGSWGRFAGPQAPAPEKRPRGGKHG
jgi:hypothetical protein